MDPRSVPSDRHALELQATAAYLGLAVGDALGATTEFMTPREIKTQHGVHDKIIGGGWLRLKPGQVTDDTTMSFALGRSILDEQSFDAQSIAESFSQWLSSKPVDVGNTVRRGIIHYRYSGTTAVPENEHDAGNGACMRALPVVLATIGASREKILQAQRIQAHVTHNNPLSDAAINCLTQMIHDCFEGTSKNELLFGPVARLVERYEQFQFRSRRQENPSGYIVDTMQAVFQSFFDTDSFRDCLIDVVNRGGDADTTGAIAGCIAGSFYGLKGIPGKWLNALNKDVLRQCEEQALALVDFAIEEHDRSVSNVEKIAL